MRKSKLQLLHYEDSFFRYTETTQVLEKSSSEHSVLTDSTFRFLRNLNYFQYNLKTTSSQMHG